MSHDRYDVLERFAPLFEAPEPSFERFLRRRDRKRRNQRIAAGVVAVAVFLVPVWIVMTGGPDDRTSTPASSGPTVPPPSERVGFIGLPPTGASPSTPELGEVVLRADGRCAGGGFFCFVWVYADGRLIWISDLELPFGANEGTTGLLEQHLTPTGVELLRSAFISTGKCTTDTSTIDCFGTPMPGPAPFPPILAPGWSDPTWGLPAEAWEDPEIRAFVPSRFGVCVLEDGVVSASSYASWRRIEPSRILASLPRAAADLLRGRDEVEQRGMLSALPMTCFAVATEEARALSETLDDAGFERHEHMKAFVLGYHLKAPLRPAIIWFGPMLPHEEWIVTGFG